MIAMDIQIMKGCKVERFLNFMLLPKESRQIGVDNADRIAPSLDEILYDLSLQSICFLS
jgi:hypothetical protein